MFSVILNTEANCRWKATFARLFQIREGKGRSSAGENRNEYGDYEWW